MALSRYAIWQNDGIVVGMDEKKNIIKEGSVDTTRERLYEREEKREAFRQGAINAWNEYQETGLHVTGDEVIAWLDTWGEENEKAAPVCHK